MAELINLAGVPVFGESATRFGGGLEELVHFLAQIYTLIIIAAAIVSWVQVDRGHPIVQFLFKVTEPLFKWIRELIPPFSGLDLSPLLALLLVKLVEKVLIILLVF